MDYITNQPIVDVETIDKLTTTVTKFGPGSAVDYLGWDVLQNERNANEDK